MSCPPTTVARSIDDASCDGGCPRECAAGAPPACDDRAHHNTPPDGRPEALGAPYDEPTLPIGDEEP